jgi:outer membrane protein, multidrug efflux system
MCDCSRHATGLRIAVAAAFTLSSGCAVGPDYAPPKSQTDAQFLNMSASAFSPDDARPDFWSLFADPMLSDLVQAALAENKDIDRARANLRASRAGTRLTGFDSWPTVTAQATHLHLRLSEQQAPGLSGPALERDEIEAGFDASWELDLFGRVRRGREAARADEQAASAQLRDAQVTVTGEVARNYFVLRGLQEQLAVAERNAVNQEQTLGITRARLDAGRGTELDRSRAEAQWKTTLASIPPLRSSIATTAYRLAVLTGRTPEALASQLAVTQPMPALPEINAIGTPDALLRRRPDIRAAERALASSTARIGVAVGDLFPRVNLIGSVGYSAAKVDGLGDPQTNFHSYGPSISWAAFDLGRVRARIDIAEAQTQAALATYESTVLNALEETEGALITYGAAQSRRATLQEAAAASTRAADLARQRFEGGLADFLNVLEAERDMLAAQDSLAQSRTQTATSLVAVYKALGGGWVE